MQTIRAELGGRLRLADIRLVIGTRPEAIKLKPVADALAARGIAPTLIFTGQHPSLDAREFGLDKFARVILGCPGEEDPHAHVRSVTARLLPHLRRAPDLLVVQGDTSSALGGALAGFNGGVPVAHVEAGLRTHDPLLPWPEEEYRTAIDAGADLLFAPTELAAANLRAEKVGGEVHVTGNSGIDALLDAASRLPPPTLRDGGAPSVLVTCHRRESWRDGLSAIAAAVTELAADGARVDVILHPNAYVAGSMRRLLGHAPGVSLLEPCGHGDILRRMRDATMVLSDSGGIQEEAPALGVPLLVLREKTERPEGVAAGTARLVGTDQVTIVREARRLLTDPVARAEMSLSVFPFGDGGAGGRIAAVISDWLEERSLTRRLA
ncbi:MAG: non-hydrolyzing UDP-N-acetylglucosamine 2-epimerase [Sphingomonas sp.]